MSDKDKKKIVKDMRDNLRTSQQQGAYTQLIGKEQALQRNRVKTDLARIEPVFGVNNKYLGMFKKDDSNNRAIKIGNSIVKLDTSKINPMLNTQNGSGFMLPFEDLAKPYTYNQKDPKDVHFTREKFLNQPLSKEVYRLPIKSSDAYGWLPPIDHFVDRGHGVHNLDGDGFMSADKFKRFTKGGK